MFVTWILTYKCFKFIADCKTYGGVNFKEPFSNAVGQIKERLVNVYRSGLQGSMHMHVKCRCYMFNKTIYLVSE